MKNLRDACSVLFSEKLLRAEEVLEIILKNKSNQWKYYSKPEWESAKSLVYSRDGRKCCKCFGISELNIDHIIPKSKVPALALDDDNLRVLCWPCNKAKNTVVELDYLL